jgi:hypothetical protein
MGKLLLLLGILLAAVGILLMVIPKVPMIGKLPGDIVIRRGNFTMYFPLATSLLVSLVITVLLYIFRR